MTSYPTPPFTRPALAPGILGAIVLMAGLALLDNSSAFYWIKIVVSVFALIVAVFAWQSKQWWWILVMAVIVVAWNPFWPLNLHGQFWVAGQFLAALGLIIAGVLIKVPNPDYKARK
ncbi:MAG: hypothetical protein KF742_10250 [Cryobacterium sp.]|nr:hypothetical protein [Cryobacterium sp.]MBX3090410.1 hypothetical protein [Cryobacterium sp.]MCC7127713.1 hypothetical protein [Microbacteriaceae bacterium]